MATTLKQTESVVDYPPAPDGLSEAAAALDSDAIWQRIESYCSHRWSERDVEWIAEGPGEWTPPLIPAVIDAVEIWSDGGWVEAFPVATALGGVKLQCANEYRIRATVGADVEVPAAAAEAFRRLVEYSADSEERSGVTAYSSKAGDLGEDVRRAANWKSKAMQNSGAGDLLRPFRGT